MLRYLRARLGWLPRRFAALSLRSRLVLLAMALVALGLTVSDTVVLSSVRGQLVQRVDQQLNRFGDSVAHRVGVEGTPAPRAGRSGRAWLPSQYVIAFAADDGKVTEQFRQPVAAGDPGRCGR